MILSMKRKSCAALLAMTVVFAPGAVSAQFDSFESLTEEVQRLRRDLQDVQREVYSNYSPQPAGTMQPIPDQPAAAPTAPSSGPVDMTANSAKLSVRMAELEERLRVVTGQLEEITFRQQQTNQAVNKLAKDMDFRLRTLEKQAGISPLEADPMAALPEGTMQFGTTMATQPMPMDPNTPPPDLATVTTEGVDVAGQSFSTTIRTTDPQSSIAMGAIPGDANAQYEAAKARLMQGDFAGAEVAFKYFLEQYEDHPQAGEAQYWLGETYFVRGAYRDAGQAFTVGLSKYADSSRGPDSLLKLGMSLVALNQTKEACATFNELGRRFPNAMQTVVQRVKVEKQNAGCKR